MSIANWKRRLSTHRYAALAMILVVMLPVISAIAGNHRKYPIVESMAPVPTPIGISGRTMFRFRDGECIVIRPPVAFVSEEEQRRYRGTDEETELVRHALPPGSRWRTNPNHPEEQSSFNCATFAIGEVVGLSRLDFLEPRAVSYTNMQNPAHVLLQEFFSCVGTYPVAEVNQLDELESINDNDVVVFASHGIETEYIHLGKIAKANGSNWMVSKMGRGPIVRGTIQRTAQTYEGRFDEIRIYRRR